ncbi:MAG: hypothetical protein KGI98_15295 [Euryarchaeota archaeon]|nr:hypothetical protein [Euryarchaeota archaeon]MDE1881608.1 hypothetical protein [Euryarchaeota archaeon]MDE2045995.1 hypothetical protein [Thermoplasmata archaeon]
MEIRIERRLRGSELREEILARYGSLQQLTHVASRKGAFEAQNDLATLEEFEEDPARLTLPMVVTTVATLSAKDLERLTPERLRLLEVLASRRDTPSLTTLARRLHRDKKNVSEDLRLLARFKLVSIARRGKERLARPLGSEIHILLRGAAS